MKAFTPIKFRNVELINRIAMSPMCMFSALEGMPNDFHFVHYGSHAMGGVGMVMVEATAVVPEGRISPMDLGIWNDKQVQELGRIAQFVHENSPAKIGIQLAHAGRKASTIGRNQLTEKEGGWETVSASAITYQPDYIAPKELTISEIKDLVEAFKTAARKAIRVGYDIIEIHAAHGYLIHQFLSPLSNHRTDEYGGSLHNRCRFLLEIVEAVNQELSENQALFVRISGDEYAEGGWNIEQSGELAILLKEKGVDLVDVSSGGNIHGAKITLFNGYQVPFSEAIRKKANLPVGAVGLITTMEEIEEILTQDRADLVFLARELLRNPFFVSQNAMKFQENYFLPPQYVKARK